MPQCGTGAIHELFLPCDWHVNRAVGTPLVKRTIPRLECGPDRQVASRNPSERNAWWARRRKTGFLPLRNGPAKHVPPGGNLPAPKPARTFEAPSAEAKWDVSGCAVVRPVFVGYHARSNSIRTGLDGGATLQE